MIAMKVRRTTVEEWDIPDLPDRLMEGLSKTRRTIDDICGSAGMSRSAWYKVIGDKQHSIDYEKLMGLCRELGIDLPELNEAGDRGGLNASQ